MSNVTLTIGGRPFTVACAKGEEKHVTALGKVIDSKLSSMDSLSGQNEVRTLLFAALLLADELHDAREARAAAKEPAPPAGIAPELTERLETIASKMENLALSLETEADSA
jgi:cell division protein ZapA